MYFCKQYPTGCPGSPILVKIEMREIKASNFLRPGYTLEQDLWDT